MTLEQLKERATASELVLIEKIETLIKKEAVEAATRSSLQFISENILKLAEDIQYGIGGRQKQDSARAFANRLNEYLKTKI